MKVHTSAHTTPFEEFTNQKRSQSGTTYLTRVWQSLDYIFCRPLAVLAASLRWDFGISVLSLPPRQISAFIEATFGSSTSSDPKERRNTLLSDYMLLFLIYLGMRLTGVHWMFQDDMYPSPPGPHYNTRQHLRHTRKISTAWKAYASFGAFNTMRIDALQFEHAHTVH